MCNIATNECAQATCKDGVENGTETDIDCGSDCAKCDLLKKCKLASDCGSSVCRDTGAGLQCQAPTNTDGAKNGNETGIDCGGAGNPTCADGQGCMGREDCTSDYCKLDTCTAIVPGDGVQNGKETDVDCGGVGNARCDDTQKCLVDADCKSDVCSQLVCQPPSYTDGKKNGDETDVDCGGDPTRTYNCSVGSTCLVGDDCASKGCNYNKKCSAGRSCITRFGGDTCGSGGAGGAPGEAAAWEDCCTTLPVTTVSGGTVYMDKYPTTAGRMRVFMESINYNVRGFVQGARAAGQLPIIPITASTSANPPLDGVNPVLDATWDKYLPTSFEGNGGVDELSEGAQNCTGPGGSSPCSEGGARPGIYTAVKNHLGGTIFRSNAQSSTGCFVGAPGTHSFRFNAAQGQDGAAPAQSQDVYDTKFRIEDRSRARAYALGVFEGGGSLAPSTIGGTGADRRGRAP